MGDAGQFVNAVHRENHEEAIGWYDKGRDILTTTTIDSEFVVPRRDGEELVSMGVSYWNQGQKDLAVELTEEGARLMGRAAKAGVISSDDLAVPYGNLTAMYKRLDNSVKALEYGRLVRSVKGDEAANDIEKPAAEQAKPAAKGRATTM